MIILSLIDFTRNNRWFWGYSLVYSETGGVFLGNLDNFCFMGVLGRAVPETNNKLPEIVSASCFPCELVTHPV